MIKETAIGLLILSIPTILILLWLISEKFKFVSSLAILLAVILTLARDCGHRILQ